MISFNVKGVVNIRYAKKIITRTLWEYGLNPYSHYTLIFEDGRKHYRITTPYSVYDGYTDEDYIYQLLFNFIRSPRQRNDRLSDTYEVTLKICNPENGKVIRKF